MTPMRLWKIEARRLSRLFSRALLLGVVSLAGSGCAVKQALNDDPRDPWEGYNRHVFAFNESVDVVVLTPVAKGYRALLPEFARRGVSNFFSNVEDLPSALNNFLQADFAGAGNDVLRFLINSTLGVLGLFDPATSMGLTKQDEDFGQTLGVWGVGPGPYFVLPLFGPSTLRDFPGRIVDFLIYPLNWVDDSGTRNVLQGVRLVSTREGFLDQEAILRKLSPDYYQQLKSFYLNRRQHLITDGAVEIDESLYQ